MTDRYPFNQRVLAARGSRLLSLSLSALLLSACAVGPDFVRPDSTVAGSVLPDSYTLEHYATVFTDSKQMIGNTLLYCFIAAGLDVVIGTSIAYHLTRIGITPPREPLARSSATSRKEHSANICRARWPTRCRNRASNRAKPRCRCGWWARSSSNKGRLCSSKRQAIASRVSVVFR